MHRTGGAPSLALAWRTSSRAWAASSGSSGSGTTSPSCSRPVHPDDQSTPARASGVHAAGPAGHVYKPLGRTSWMPGVIARAPPSWRPGILPRPGGARSARRHQRRSGAVRTSRTTAGAVALCVATTILIKMHRWRCMWVTCAPLAWLVVVTYTASYQKIFSDAPRIGFLAQARALQASVDAGRVAPTRLPATQALILQQPARRRADGRVRRARDAHPGRLDPRVAGILRGRREARVTETPFVLTRLRAGTCERAANVRPPGDGPARELATRSLRAPPGATRRAAVAGGVAAFHRRAPRAEVQSGRSAAEFAKLGSMRSLLTLLLTLSLSR